MTSEKTYVDVLKLINIDLRDFVKLFSNFPELMMLNEDLLKHLDTDSIDWDNTTTLALKIVSDAAENANNTVKQGVSGGYDACDFNSINYCSKMDIMEQILTKNIMDQILTNIFFICNSFKYFSKCKNYFPGQVPDNAETASSTGRLTGSLSGLGGTW